MVGEYNNREQDLKTIYQEFINEFNHIYGVMGILKQFIYLWDENIWESLFNVYVKWKNPFNIPDPPLTIPVSLLLAQAIRNGIQPRELIDDYQDSNVYLVDYETFHNLHIFLEKLYSLHLGRELVEDDLWALHKSDLPERVLGGLEVFDIFKGNLFLGDDFFQQIKSVIWDEEALIFCKKLQNLLITFLFENKNGNETIFSQELEKVVVLLAHCSAVSSDSQYIIIGNVVRAYNALFKIINTDITHLVNKKYYTGFLICKDCNEFYPLLENESPHDFSHCSCGGGLEYLSSENSNNSNDNQIFKGD
ncbi:hypothetical protein BK007_03995 [Methanobacterium subterraneum]|uniref:Uncharacterized protein n=1 Tax=Methanobacterium subterraneum TaxID=59277 RepID=A0A2H4VAZ7_9EURY|nr:hypothetical protein [Methanobacterium subterraneum]AUB55258.1 hypothetical protein BK007_03995 [Methanobacterium subterraneum]MBW4256343.1 hypothetical protein [Methanobacterium sp. YSL]PKL73249.1 MAG: hypothetical protein CVV29_04490 [Methanobacteriales archaeon HGW-Methanobacteriales-2]